MNYFNAFISIFVFPFGALAFCSVQQLVDFISFNKDRLQKQTKETNRF